MASSENSSSKLEGAVQVNVGDCTEMTALGDLRVILSSADTSREKGAKRSIIFFF